MADPATFPASSSAPRTIFRWKQLVYSVMRKKKHIFCWYYCLIMLLILKIWVLISPSKTTQCPFNVKKFYGLFWVTVAPLKKKTVGKWWKGKRKTQRGEEKKDRQEGRQAGEQIFELSWGPAECCLCNTSVSTPHSYLLPPRQPRAQHQTPDT